MIDPSGIPQYEGEPEQVLAHAEAMASAAGTFASTGQDVHSTWQGLAGVYTAPEAGQLFAATQPVADRATGVADEVGLVSAALTVFAETMAPIKTRLEEIRTEAQTMVEAAEADDEWDDDGDNIDAHNALMSEVGRLVAEWQAAERECANAINAAFGSSFRYVADNGDETVDVNEYGYDAETFETAVDEEVELPWGTVEHEDPGSWGNVGGFFQGVFVDGVWGDIRGLGTLVGVDGGDAAAEAWGNLGVLASSLTTPGIVYGMADPEYGQRQLDLWGALGSSMVASDTWDENGGRAFGQVLWNFGSLAIGGVGAVGKAGKLGKLGTLAAAGRITVSRLFETAVRTPVSDLAARIGSHLSELSARVDVPTRSDVHLDLPDAPDAPRVDVPDAGRPDLPDAGRPDLPDAGRPDLPDAGGGDLPGGTATPDAPGTPDGATTPDGGTAPDAPDGSAPDAPTGGADPANPPLDPTPAGQPRPSWETFPDTSDAVSRVDAEHPPLDVSDLDPVERGQLGEALTRADLEAQGFEIVAEQRQIWVPNSDAYFVPDFIARDPAGNVVLVESKFGSGAGYTPNQVDGYGDLAGGQMPLVPRASDFAASLRGPDGSLPTVDRVVTYRWNTDLVPDEGLLTRAYEDLGW
ncbi:hypothetical protein [Blastococcus sp. SYSU D00813]